MQKIPSNVNHMQCVWLQTDLCSTRLISKAEVKQRKALIVLLSPGEGQDEQCHFCDLKALNLSRHNQVMDQALEKDFI